MFLSCWSRRCNPQCCLLSSFSFCLPNPHLDRFSSPEIQVMKIWCSQQHGEGTQWYKMVRMKPFKSPVCQDVKTFNQIWASWFAGGWEVKALCAQPRWWCQGRCWWGMSQGTARQGQKKKVVTHLGHMAVTKTWEDGMAGKHSRYLAFLKGGGSDVCWECAWLSGEGVRVSAPLLGGEELEGE